MNKLEDYLPYLVGVLVALLALNLWYLSSLAVTEKVVPSTYGYFASLAIAILGTFSGAAAAFYLNERKETRQLVRARVNLLRAAQFRLIQQINTLETVNRVLAEHKDSEARHIYLPGKLRSSQRGKLLEISDLEFILEDHDPNLLMALSVEQERFETAIAVVEDRYDFHLNQFQPALEPLENLEPGRTATTDEVRQTVGERIWLTAISHSDNVYKHVPETVESLLATLEDLTALAKESYSQYKFIEFQLTAEE